MRLQIEKVVEEIKMWKNDKIGFAEMNEDRNVKDGVWVRLLRLMA